MTDDATPTAAEEFRAEQKAAAADQNQSADNAVPEQRPQVTIGNTDQPQVSPLTEHLRNEGALGADDEPMPQEAYDRAASAEQRRKAAKESVSEGIHTGNTVVATKGPHEGRIFAVTGIAEYRDSADRSLVASGDPRQLYVQPLEVRVTAVGDDRDGERLTLNVDDNGLEKLNEAEARRGGHRR